MEPDILIHWDMEQDHYTFCLVTAHSAQVSKQVDTYTQGIWEKLECLDATEDRGKSLG